MSYAADGAVLEPAHPAGSPSGSAASSYTSANAQKPSDTQDAGHSSHAKKHTALAVLIIAACLAALAYFYISYADRFRGVFLPGTFINGTDVSGWTADQYESRVSKQLSSWSCTITFPGGTSESLKSADIDLSYLPNNGIASYIEHQNVLTWIAGYFGYKRDVSYIPTVTYSDQKVLSAISSWPELSGDQVTEPVDAHLDFDDSGHLTVIPETEGNQLDSGIVEKSVLAAVTKMQTSLDLSETDGILLRPSVYSDDEKLNSCMNDLNGFLDTTVTWTMSDGSTKTLDAKVLDGWLTKEDDGTYSITDDAIAEKSAAFIAELAASDDNYGTSRTFGTTNFGTIKLTTESPHGHALDQASMASALTDTLKNRSSGSLDVLYSQYEDSGLAVDGNSYLEVDIDNQTVYCYKDGSLAESWPVVTGLVGSHSTPYGIYKLERKFKDTVLQGPMKNGKPSYSAHVEYFNQFFPTYGFHDASWRSESEFGGDTYQNDGSHGCINMPLEGAQYIYESVDTGTPVIVFSDSHLDKTVLRYHYASEYTAECQTHEDIGDAVTETDDDDDDGLSSDES